MPDPQRRVLLITRNLPPLRGGMERLNLNMARAITPEATVSISGPLGCSAYLPSNVSQVIEVPHRPLPLFLFRSFVASLRLLRRGRPSHVLAGSGLTAPVAWVDARATGARLVVYVHGLDLIAPNRIYQWLWLPFIRRADLVIANSRNTSNLAAARGVHARALVTLHPGTELPAADDGARRRFRSRIGVGESPMLLSVGRMTKRKGLPEFIRSALPVVLARHPGLHLVVIGDDAIDAVGAARGSERERILRAAAKAGVEHAVRLHDPCDDATLSDAYQAADIHVFPVREVAGDVEGFGMVAIEAAAHGLPTVAFDVGGVADAVVEGRSGSLIPSGDYEGFAAAINGLLQTPQPSATREECRRAAAAFSWDEFGRRLRELLFARRKGND